MTTLYVLWQTPLMGTVHSDARCLSFLSPKEEQVAACSFPRLVSARTLAPEVKKKAIPAYISLWAKIGSTPLQEQGGKTLRQLLKNKDGMSEWWFNKAVEKDTETSEMYVYFIQALTIDYLAKREGATQIHFIGAPPGFDSILGHAYTLTGLTQRRSFGIKKMVKAFAYRWGYGARFACQARAVKKIKDMSEPFEIGFAGFWNWSVKVDQVGELEDAYFTTLPRIISESEYRVGWLAWLSSDAWGGQALSGLLFPLKHQQRVVLLNGLLSIKEIFLSIFNIRNFLTIKKNVNKKSFIESCIYEGLYFDQMIGDSLLESALNHTDLESKLLYLASKKAFSGYPLKACYHFLELFVHTRSVSAASRAVSPQTRHLAIQHASYSWEKTFGRIDPILEYEGSPDGCRIPIPDYVFAMGNHGRVLFGENGWREERCFLTGSSRYQTKGNVPSRPSHTKPPFRLLLVTSLAGDKELEMIEAAYFAVQKVPSFEVHLRTHPFNRIERTPAFSYYQDTMTVSQQSLQDDLSQADLVLFSHSTVGEEAVLKGVPVIRWNTWQFNGSVLGDLQLCKQVDSIASLVDVLNAFKTTPHLFEPEQRLKDQVEFDCFYRLDGQANYRIWERSLRLLTGKHD